MDFWNENDYIVSLVMESSFDEFDEVNGSEILNGDGEIWTVNDDP